MPPRDQQLFYIKRGVPATYLSNKGSVGRPGPGQSGQNPESHSGRCTKLFHIGLQHLLDKPTDVLLVDKHLNERSFLICVRLLEEMLNGTWKSHRTLPI